MSKQQTNTQHPSPVEAISACEADIARLEGKREQLAQRVAEHASARERLSYRAHVQQDAEASKELAEAREAALHAERELTEIDSALVTARGKLNEAQGAAAREERRAQIKEQEKLSKEFRHLKIR